MKARAEKPAPAEGLAPGTGASPRPGLARLGLTGLVAIALGLIAAIAPAAHAVSPSAPHAARRAILIGVSELARQSPSLWLQAPRNDVIALRGALLEQGFRPEDITVLADGVEGGGSPDSANIQAELARLTEISQPGDTLLLYFSGHGMRARPGAKNYQEPDRLSEVFLARDALRAIPGTLADTSNIDGILRDDQLGAHIHSLLARDVFVLAIFDTCAAASMTRGGDATAHANANGAEHADIRWRGLHPAQLAAAAHPRGGKTKTTQTHAENTGNAGASADQPGAAATHSANAPAHTDFAQIVRARYVALHASESHQLTPEMRLPRGSRHGVIHGLLTWSLLQALNNRPQTYREWFNIALDHYAPALTELERLYPTRELPSPVAEGALDTALWSNPAAPLTARPAWPARLTGNRLSLRFGQFDGLEARHPVRVTALQSNGQRLSAVGALEQVSLQEASLTVPAALQKAVNPLWSISPLDTPDAPPAAHALRVHSATPLPPGIDLDFPFAIRLVGEKEADVRVSAETDVHISSAMNTASVASDNAASATPAYRLEALPGLVAPLANWLKSDDRNGAAQAAQITPLDGTALRQRLIGLAQLKWWHRLAALCAGMQLPGFEVSMEDDRSRPGKHRRSLRVRNRRAQSLDVVIASLAQNGRTHLLYPTERGESNRFEAANGPRPSEIRLPLPESGPGARRQLLIVASPAKSRTPPRFFGVAAAPPEEPVRLRGALSETASEAYCTLQDY